MGDVLFAVVLLGILIASIPIAMPAVRKAWPPAREWTKHQLEELARDAHEEWRIAKHRWAYFRSMSPLSKYGRLLLVAGLILAGFFLFFYDTTGGRIGEARIHNIGLLQNRMLGSIAGMVMAVVGAILLVADAKTNR